MNQTESCTNPARPSLKASLLLTLALALFLAGGCASSPPLKTDGSPGAGIIEEWGVEITAVRISAAGYVVDFRYRVHDAEKAKPLFVRKIKPFLIQQSTGKTLPLYRSAKVGPMRSSYMPKEDRIYTILFSNSGRIVKAGDKVTVQIGEFVVENLVVE